MEKEIFKINGVPFGNGCTGVRISCEVTERFDIRLDIETTVKFASYGMNGKKKTDYTLAISYVASNGIKITEMQICQCQ